MAISDYENDLQQQCPKLTQVGESIECENAYYSARKVLPPTHLTTDDGVSRWQGKLRDLAFAAQIDTVSLVSRVCIFVGNPPSALSAKVIFYECAPWLPALRFSCCWTRPG